MFVVGKVVDRAPQLSWFSARPLFGTSVLVAGSPATSERLRDQLAALGADVITGPAIRITDPPDWAPVDAALERLDEYDWLVFSSGNGVDYLFRRLFDQGGDARRLGSVKLAAVGSATAERLSRYAVRPIVVAMTGMILFSAVLLCITLEATTWVRMLWLLFGFFGTAGIVPYAVLSQSFPAHLSGRVNTALNLMVFVVAFVAQWGTGSIIELWPTTVDGGYAPAGYRAAFGIMVALQTLALIWFFLAGRKLAYSKGG